MERDFRYPQGPFPRTHRRPRILRPSPGRWRIQRPRSSGIDLTSRQCQVMQSTTAGNFLVTLWCQQVLLKHSKLHTSAPEQWSGRCLCWYRRMGLMMPAAASFNGLNGAVSKYINWDNNMHIMCSHLYSRPTSSPRSSACFGWKRRVKIRLLVTPSSA